MKKAYPWDQWFRRGLFTLLPGRDYSCPQDSMRQQLGNEASKRGLKIRVERLLSGGFVVRVTERRTK